MAKADGCARFFESESTLQNQIFLPGNVAVSQSQLHRGEHAPLTIGDVVARVNALRGFNVCTDGLDAFGLPLRKRRHNESHSPKPDRQQYRGISADPAPIWLLYDCVRVNSTCRSGILQVEHVCSAHAEARIAYKKKSRVNWLPHVARAGQRPGFRKRFCWRHEETLVANPRNEQCLAHHRVLRSTAQDLKQLEGGGPDRVITMQRNWTCKSEGRAREFCRLPITRRGSIEVFTTRIDTIYGVIGTGPRAKSSSSWRTSGRLAGPRFR